jgi:hypothetical protein
MKVSLIQALVMGNFSFDPRYVFCGFSKRGKKGVSRSTTLVVAYLMERCHLSLQKACTMVKSIRPVVCPNSGFIRQLLARARKAVSPDDDIWIQDLFLHPGKGVLEASRTSTVECENGLLWNCGQVVGSKDLLC